MPFSRQPPWLIYTHQSFANVSKVTTDQLQSLPGFGQVKVKNIKNAFEKPFRNQTTTSLSIPQTRKSGTGESSQAEAVHQDQPTSHVSRESSPIWDIELDEGELPSDNWTCNQFYRFDIEYCMSTLFPRKNLCIFYYPLYAFQRFHELERIYVLSLCDFFYFYVRT